MSWINNLRSHSRAREAALPLWKATGKKVQYGFRKLCDVLDLVSRAEPALLFKVKRQHPASASVRPYSRAGILT